MKDNTKKEENKKLKADKKVNKPSDPADKIVLLKSITAFVCVVGVCVAANSVTGKVADTIKNMPVNVTVQTGVVSAAGNSSTTGSGSMENTYEFENQAPTEPSDNGTESTPAETTNNAQTGKNESNGPKTKAEIINYCNTALNNAKAAKIGYTKKFVREVSGGVEGLPSVVTKALLKDETKDVKKGTDIKNDFPAAGYDWSSKLRESDVTEATIKKVGQNYEIILKLGQEKNPAKGEASSYGRVMSVIDAAEAQNMVKIAKDISMTYYDGYVSAKIDSKTGKLVQAEFSASADIEAVLFGKKLSVKKVVSTETFSNIKF